MLTYSHDFFRQPICGGAKSNFENIDNDCRKFGSFSHIASRTQMESLLRLGWIKSEEFRWDSTL